MVEMMISIVIALFLLGGLVSLVVTNSVNSAELNKSGIQIENGRYAMQLLLEDVQHAGFWGAYAPTSATVYSIPSSSNLCDATAPPLGFTASPASLPVGLYGYDGSDTTPSCTPAIANRRANTDILVLRHVSSTPIPVASAVSNEVYLQVQKCSTPPMTPFVIDSNTANFIMKKKDCATVESIRKYMVHIYYISDCNVCGTDTIPTLKLVELIAGSFVVTPLVEGIENLQIEYGLDTNGDGAPDCFTSNPSAVPAAEKTACSSAATYFSTATALLNWSNVVAARVHVLARNLEATAGWADNRTYDLGLAATVAATNDQFKRHAYGATARVYNLSSQREIP